MPNDWRGRRKEGRKFAVVRQDKKSTEERCNRNFGVSRKIYAFQKQI